VTSAALPPIIGDNGKPKIAILAPVPGLTETGCHLCGARFAVRHHMAGCDVGEDLGASICTPCAIESAPAVVVAVEGLNLLQGAVADLGSEQAGMLAASLAAMAGALTARDLPPAEPTPAETDAYVKAVERVVLSVIARRCHRMGDVPLAGLVDGVDPLDVIGCMTSLFVEAVEAGGADPLAFVRDGAERLAEGL